jgi:thioredoxin reductase
MPGENSKKSERDVIIDFEGREIHCTPGISLAAALTDAGELALRQADDGEMRGLFCGMGVCQECRMEVDGQSGVRACMTVASRSLKVLRQVRSPEAKVTTDSCVAGGEPKVEEPDVLVIGAGPAGLTAAAVAAESGAEVVVLDERAKAGGQYHKQPYSCAQVPESLAGDRQFADGKVLIDRAQGSGATLIQGVEVWGAFAPKEFMVFDGTGSTLYRPKCAIVATGAFERGLPLPGWTLPGVMTTGAAQTLLRSYGVLAGKRILVAGNGPLNLQVALELKRAGADLVAVAELARKPALAALLPGLRMASIAPQLTMNGQRILAKLRNLKVPLLFQHGLASVEATSHGLKASVGPATHDGVVADKSYDVDVVCMGYGFQPNNEILRCLGCKHSYDNSRGYLVTDRGPACETSVAGIYAVGDCCGLGGAPAAREEAVIAAADAVRSLGLQRNARLEREEKFAIRDLRQHRRFQIALWQLFAAPHYQTELAAPETLICRCEEISLQQLETALADGDMSIGAIKQRTRLGMGPCQGRYCAPVVAAMIAKRQGVPAGEFSLFAPRVPIKPIRIVDIVGGTSE